MTAEPTTISARPVKRALTTTALYGKAVKHIAPRGGRSLRRRVAREERMIFVIGSPRSGTTFLAGVIGGCPGFVDLGEVAPLKSAIPQIYGLAEEEVASHVRSTIEHVRHLSLVQGLRGVEQTPETTFVIDAALLAYPQSRAVHIIRDGRDVACSLLEKGWLSVERTGHDDAFRAFGSKPRFWVEPERIEEFEQASDATRAAWAWRRYVTAALEHPRTLELRYQTVIQEPEKAAGAVADHLGIDREPIERGLEKAYDRAIGRYQKDLSPEQLADVEREAGPLLRELGFV
jgi:hypothetical protein